MVLEEANNSGWPMQTLVEVGLELNTLPQTRGAIPTLRSTSVETLKHSHTSRPSGRR